MNPIASVSMLGRSNNGTALVIGAAVIVALIYASAKAKPAAPATK